MPKTHTLTIKQASRVIEQLELLLPNWPESAASFDRCCKLHSDYADLKGLLAAAEATAGVVHIRHSIAYLRSLQRGYSKIFRSGESFTPEEQAAILSQLREMLDSSEAEVEQLNATSTFEIALHDVTAGLLGLNQSNSTESIS